MNQIINYFAAVPLWVMACVCFMIVAVALTLYEVHRDTKQREEWLRRLEQYDAGEAEEFLRKMRIQHRLRK